MGTDLDRPRDECCVEGCHRPAFYRIGTATAVKTGQSTGIYFCWVHTEQYAESLKPPEPEPVQ